MYGGLRSYLHTSFAMVETNYAYVCNALIPSSAIEASHPAAYMYLYIPKIFRSHSCSLLQKWAALSRAWRHNDSDHANLAPRLLDCSMHGICDLQQHAQPAADP